MRPTIVAVASLLALSSLPACQKPEASAGSTKPTEVALPPVKVETAEVGHEKVPRYLTLTGTVQADRQSEVAANVAGRLVSTTAERGQRVQLGQVLAVVDAKQAGLSAAAATAQSQAAETQVSLAKQECDRADTLFGQGALSKAEFDRLKSQCTAQLFSATAARANADIATKLAGDTVIRAPFDGVVGERYVNVGEYVQPMTRVASVYSASPARVSISVPEAAIGQIKEGQTLDVKVAAWPGRSFPAVLRFISPALRNVTRDLIIEAQARNDDLALKPGMFASVQLQIGEEEQPTVPSSAVRVDGTVRRIYLARKGQAFEVVVRTGVTLGERVAVLEPIEAGARVILQPPPGLRDGASIQ